MMNTMTGILLWILLLTGFAPWTRPQQDRPEWYAELVEQKMKAGNIPGAVVGVVEGERLASYGAFGLRDVERRLPMRPTTLFQIGSVTKPLTATLALLLASQGELDLDASLGEYLPADSEARDAIRAITLRQLLSHTSGLPRDPVNRRDRPGSPSVMLPYSTQELYAGLRETKLEAPSGQRFAYSNLGYLLAGHVLELATGEDYRTLLRERLFEPLRMDASGIDPSDEQEKQLAVHYWPEDARRTPRERWKFGEIAGASGVFSSVFDLARFAVAQYSEEEDLLAGFRSELHKPVLPLEGGHGRSVALGWFVDPLPPGGKILGHGGEVDGHSACLAVLPEQRLALIVLCNQGGDSAEALCRLLMPALLERVKTGGAR